MDIRFRARVHHVDGPRTVTFVLNVPDASFLPELTPEQLEYVLSASLEDDHQPPAVSSATAAQLDEVAPRKRYMHTSACTCSICLDEYSARTRRYVRTLLCGHTFCCKCISKWVSQHSATCPTCRKPLLD